MTNQQGFILTRESYDINNTTYIVLWVKTDDGPAKLIIRNEQVVFFIKQSQLIETQLCLNKQGIDYQVKPLSLQTFQHEAVSGVYFNTLQASRSAQYALNKAKINIFEADFRLHDRYLMERFIHAGIEFSGQPSPNDKFNTYDNVRIRTANYTPEFTVLSLDIECSMKGELFSIGLYFIDANQ